MTEKFFEFNLQLFALPETATIGASDNNVVVEGSDTLLGTSSIESVPASNTTLASAIANEIAPKEDDTQNLDGIAYTFDGSNWTYNSDTTATASTETSNQINATYAPSEGNSHELDGITYTFTDGEWTFPSDTTSTQTASDDIAEQLANNYAPNEGDSYELDDVEYTFTNGNWTSTTTADNQDELTAAWQAANPVDPSEGDTQGEYTFTDGVWVSTTEAEDQDAITAAYQAANAPNPSDGDTYDTYTYTNGTWTSEANIQDVITAAYQAANAPTPSDGDAQDNYTYTNGVWISEADNQDELTAAWQADNPANPEEGTEYDNYTFDGSNWIAEADDSDAITAAWQDANPDEVLDEGAAYNDPDSGVDYTYKNSVWIYEAPADEQDNITTQWQADNPVDPADGDTQDNYTYTNGVWISEADNQDEITANWQVENAPDPDEGATYENYTFTNGVWISEADNQDEITANWQAENASDPSDGDTQDGYTYEGGVWTSTTEAENQDEITAAWQADNAPEPADGDTQDDYTFTDGVWISTTTADDATVSQILAANYAPAEGDSYELDDITYTYTDGNWTYEVTTTETATATAETAAAILAQYYSPADGDTRDLDDITYTYTDGAWTYDTTTTATATAETAAAIIAEYYTPATDDTVKVDGTTYTYSGTSWTYEYTPTITSYYQFSASVSSADAPVVIQSATTTGALANTTLAAPAVINGNGSDFAVDGVGTISGLDSGESFAVLASSGKLGAATLSGDIALTAAGKNVSQTLNGAALDYSSASKGESVSFTSSDDVVIAHSSNAVTLKSIDDKQEWLLNSDSDAALSYGKVAYSAQGDVHVTANGSILSATLDDGESLIMAKDGSGRTDVVSVNGVLITSAAKAGGDTSSTISAFDDSLVVTAGKNGGTLSVNDSNLDLADGARATISGSDSDAAITSVSRLDSKGKWILGADDVTLAGSQHWSSSSPVTLVADDAGTGISRVNFASGSVSLNAVDTSSAFAADSININGKATWGFSGSDDSFDSLAPFVAFDSDGNATLTQDDRKSASATLYSGKNLTFTSGVTGDVLSLSKGDIVSITKDEAVSANSIAAGGTWTVHAEDATLGSQSLHFESANDAGIRAILTADKSKGDIITSISDLAGDVTLTTGADAPRGLTVGSTTWTIHGAASNSFVFDPDGAVTVSAGTDALEASSRSSADSGSAVIHITNSSADAKLNGVNVTYATDAEDGVDFTLEDRSNNAGIAAISGVDEGASITVKGDNSFAFNDDYTFNSNRGDATLYVGEDYVDVNGVRNGDAITLTGGNANFNFDGNTVKSAAVSINGAGVSIDAESAADINNIAVYTNDANKIDLITGAKVTDEINTSGDDKFVVVYDAPTADATLNVNDTSITLDSDIYSSGKEITLSVDGDHVTIDGLGASATDTITVSGGNYKVGKSAAVNITETLGYIVFDGSGNATAVEKSVVDSAAARESVIGEAISNAFTDALAADSDLTAVELYQKLGGDSDAVLAALPSSVQSATVAGYEDGKDTLAASSSDEGGINVYGNAAFTSTDLHEVTLQSFTDDDIVILEEGDAIHNAIITAPNSTMIAITPTVISAVNHTVTSGDDGGYIVFGGRAKGNNYAIAGKGGTYLSNEGGNATLVGGEGADSIVAKSGDSVVGGAGADYYFDAYGGYEISDYNVSEGDVLVATKLADLNKNLDAETLVAAISVRDNTIQIADGGKFTLNGGTTIRNVVFTDANAQDLHKLAWAAQDGGLLDTSAFTDGSVLLLADQNDGASDSVVGSSGNDTIFVGGNDTVDAGAGKDEIYITAANTAKKEEGAVVALSAGRTYVHGWNYGFDNSAGANILNADASKLTFDNKADTLLAYNSSDTIYFVDNDEDTEVFDILTGSPDEHKKVSLIRSSKNVVVDSDDAVADYYYTAQDVNATLTFTENVGDITDTIRMDGGASYSLSKGGNFINIHNVALNNDGAATLVGTADKDVLVLSGAASSDARKHVSLGGGNDSVISGGTDTSVSGNTFYFGLENDGSDIINDFGYYQGSAADAERVAADKVILYNWVEGVSGITANGRNVEIKVNDNSKLTLQEERINPDNKIIYQLGYEGEERIAQVGTTSGARNNFTYDKETFVYIGNADGGADTLSVAEEDENVAVWLDGQHGTVYDGVGVIDASASTNTQLTLAGGASDNTIIAGGEGNSSSLWGGGYGNNDLIGGAGNDVFFFAKGGSNDTVSELDAASDRVRLGDITLDDLLTPEEFFDGDDIKIALKAEAGGGTLTIKDAQSGTQVEVNDGTGNYHAYTATKTGSDWSWQA